MLLHSSIRDNATKAPSWSFIFDGQHEHYRLAEAIASQEQMPTIGSRVPSIPITTILVPQEETYHLLETRFQPAIGRSASTSHLSSTRQLLPICPFFRIQRDCLHSQGAASSTDLPSSGESNSPAPTFGSSFPADCRRSNPNFENFVVPLVYTEIHAYVLFFHEMRFSTNSCSRFLDRSEAHKARIA